MHFKRSLQIALLILSTEAIYALPFVLIRIFRPTFLSAYGIDNTDIGLCFTLYGVTALVSYFIGGLIADKYQPKFLMSIALVLTGLGGLFWVAFPSLTMLYILYVYWGVTTILLFWSPMIKAACLWGGKDNQVLGFGLLEGGRGVVAAIIGTLGIVVISSNVTETHSSKLILQSAMSDVYLIISILVIFIGVLLLFLPRFGNSAVVITSKTSLANIKRVFQFPVIWVLMVIILTAYVGYRIADIFTQYANEVYAYSPKDSAKLGTVLAYLKPVVCLIIVLFARRANPSKWLIISFVIMTLGSFLLVINTGVNLFYFTCVFPIVTSVIGIYAVRVFYFTLLEEAKIPHTITGTFIGIVSIVAFSPDIFLGPIEGYYLDEVGGVEGYQYLFIFFLISSIIGLVASIFFYKTIENYKKLPRWHRR